MKRTTTKKTEENGEIKTIEKTEANGETERIKKAERMSRQGKYRLQRKRRKIIKTGHFWRLNPSKNDPRGPGV